MQATIDWNLTTPVEWRCLMVEKWLNTPHLGQELRNYKHQLLMLLRILISGQTPPRLTSNNISTYSKRIVDVLRDPDRGPSEFEKAIDFLNESLRKFGSYEGRNPPHRLRAFTERLKQDVLSKTPSQPAAVIEKSSSPGDIERGRILFFDDVRQYGFIRKDRGDNIFVHESDIAAIPYHLRVRDMEVEYTVAGDARHPGRLKATNVHLVD